MSEKARKMENVPSLFVEEISNPNKQKHNSKRRKSKKNKSRTAEKDGSDIGKVDQVVKFFCDSLPKNIMEASAGANSLENEANIFPQPVGACTNKNYNRNFLLHTASQSPSSSKDLSSLFENLQVQSPMKSDNIAEYVNIDFLKINKCESSLAEDLEKIKILKNLEEIKTSTLTGEHGYIPNESLRQYINFSVMQGSPGPSVFTALDSSSVLMPTPIEPNQNHNQNIFNVKKIQKKNISLKENFKVQTTPKGINQMSPVKSIPQVLIKDPEPAVAKSDNPATSKSKSNKKKTKKKITEPRENDSPSWNQRVFLNSGLQKHNNQVQTNPGSPSHGKTKKNSKFPANDGDTKFPKYLTPEELQSLSSFGVLLTGIIRINQKNYKEAYITAPDKGMDILIEGLKDRNRALEGDEVYFILKPKEHHRVSTDTTDIQRTAVVVGIKAVNNNRRAIGSLNVMKNKNNTFALFSPRDSRLPRIRIRKNNWPKGFAENSKDFKDKLYFAKISQWNDLRFAEGELIEEVGVAGDLEAETNAILLKYGLDVAPYGEAFKQFIPDASFKISEIDMKNREDFRKECIFTIDPQTAVDLDDAVSCKLLPNGNYEVGVHISDVSYFLKEGTPLDIAVSKRATTVYLVQKTYHMLPFELCRLCSLTPGEDKLSFSVMWEITKDCEIVNHRFARSVINSCAQFSYEQVQAIIDNVPSNESLLPKIHGDHSSAKIKEIVMFLHKVAVYLRNKRFSSGALRIDQKKIYFSLDENKLPVEYRQETHEPSHQLIEEFMLLANITVAETLNSAFPKLAFLRCHPPPLPYVLEKLQKTLEKYGITVNISSSKSIQASLSNYSGDDIESTARMLVLNNALAKPMARASYYCGGLFSEESDRRHYALNVSLYTHFTSPIRRYADVMVHRLLAASLNYHDSPNWTTGHVQEVAANCNKQKYSAKMAQEMSIELYMALYIGRKGNMVCEAVVCDIKDKSFDCIGLSTGLHQRLYFEHIEGDLEQEKEDGILRLRIKWPKDEIYDEETIQIIEMFSIVKIELKRASVLKIEARLLRYQ